MFDFFKKFFSGDTDSYQDQAQSTDGLPPTAIVDAPEGGLITQAKEATAAVQQRPDSRQRAQKPVERPPVVHS